MERMGIRLIHLFIFSLIQYLNDKTIEHFSLLSKRGRHTNFSVYPFRPENYFQTGSHNRLTGPLPYH
jgi:hypothetical protein